MKILLASDGSEQSLESARLLARLQWAPSHEVTVLTASAVPTHSYNTFYYVPSPAGDWEAQERDRVAADQAKIVEVLSEDTFSVKTMHRFGAATQVIPEVARELDVDVIVMGAQGHSMIHRAFLGSVSEYVANHSDCSVLLTRSTKGDDQPIRNALIAYDGSVSARAAVDEFVDLPWLSAPELSILSIVQRYELLMSEGVSAAVIDNEEHLVEQMRRVDESIIDEICSKIPNSKSFVKREYHVGEGIVDYAGKHGSQLLVVGDAGHSLIEDLLLGSTTKYVMRHSPCSVWISRKNRKGRSNSTTEEAAAAH